MIVSKTATAHGWGSDPYKWVSGLTLDELRAVRNGELVIVSNCPSAHGNHGDTNRRVIYQTGRGFTHRLIAEVSK